MYEVINEDQLGELIPKLEAGAYVYIDVETDGLYGKVCTLQFKTSALERCQVLVKPNFKHANIQRFLHMDVCYVAHLTAYEMSCISHELGCAWVPDKWECTFLLARLAYPEYEAFDLESLYESVLGLTPYRDYGINKKELQTFNWGRGEITDRELTYAALDVLHLEALLHRFLGKGTNQGLSYKLDKVSTKYAIKFQQNGVPVNVHLAQDRLNSNLEKITALNLPINSKSYQMVRQYTNLTDSNELALVKAGINGNERAGKVLEVRKLCTENSALKKMIKTVKNGRIYGHFSPAAKSGRFTCTEQNLQQIPRSFHGLVEAKDGYVLAYSDYAQLELRTIAAVSGCSVMRRIFQEGGDLHITTAKTIYQTDTITKAQRQIAKSANFLLLYLGSHFGLVDYVVKTARIILTEEEAKEVVRGWQKTYPGVFKWQMKGRDNFFSGVLGSTPFGRRYRARRATDFLNIENQGFGAEIAKLALHYMYDSCVSAGAKMVNFQHDSYMWELPNDMNIIKEVAAIIGRSMLKSWQEGCKKAVTKDIPMPVKVQVAHNWGDIERDQNIIYTLNM